MWLGSLLRWRARLLTFWFRERDFERDAQRVSWSSKSIWWVSWPRRNAASYQPRNLNSSLVFDNFLLYIIREHAVGKPSAIEGQTANILIREVNGTWARCSTSVLEFEKYWMSFLAETKRRVIPATKFKFFTSIWQFFIVYHPGKANSPDALSRPNSLRQTDLGEEYDSEQIIVESCMPVAVSPREIGEATYSDAERRQVKAWVRTANWKHLFVSFS